ncbi:MAG: hydroxyacylglutathione hydrolase [Bdellovibrionales bacterium]|nr:hydroxyacylglutathione hydrolase [Bdellovibrionales bacterium]
MKTKFDIYQLPVWEDNYIYILHEFQSNQTAVIDPGDFDTVQQFLKQKNLKLDFILNTHHHFDHVGGNLKLKKEWNCKIYAYKDDSHRIPGIDQALEEKESFFIGSLKFEVLFTPGHTLGHIVFWNQENKILFCGDTLFAMGCGRLFEGTAHQMFESLNLIKKLPLETKVYCAHEYTLKNAKFALSLDSKNLHLQKRFKKISQLRKENQPTVPFLLKEECLTNPFLRVPCVSDFARIRKLRDSF